MTLGFWRSGSAGAGLAAILVLLAPCAGRAVAADRTVICEEFSATT